MRTLPTGVDTLLKSRSMIGANKPSYSIEIEGITGTVDLSGTLTWVKPYASAYGGLSYAKCTNGKIICVWSNSTATAIGQGYADDLDSFLADDSVSTVTTIFAGTGIYATVFNDNSGGLFLHLNESAIDTDPGPTQRVVIYKSPSGNGGDWELYSTVRETVQGEGFFLGRAFVPGAPLILSSGRWVLPYARYIGGAGDNFRTVGAIATSDDDGVTWTNRWIKDSYYEGWQTRNMAIYKGKIYAFYTIFAGGGAHQFLVSDDDGDTWSDLGGLETHPDFDGDMEAFVGMNFFLSGKYICFAGWNGNLETYHIYRTETPDDIESWELINDGDLNSDGAGCSLWIDNTLIVGMGVHVLGRESISALPVKSISISRNKNMAASLELVIDNKNGAYSPDRTGDFKEILWPNKTVTVKQGYGTDLVTTFTGLIDRISMTSFPCDISVSCRDYMKYLLDQLVTKAVDGGNTHILNYKAQTVEYIVTDLVTEAGLTLAETIYTTGITVDDITFSWCSWADAIQELADLVGADFGCDETGEFYFRKDYIPDTPTIAYIFQEGEDIISLGYTIDDADVYQKVVCYGTKTDGTSCFAQTNYTSRAYYNVLPHKYMKIDAGSAAQTAEAAQLLTNRAEILMRSRIRICTFAAVAVPWLQVGDVIQVIETSTTISEAYRITDLSTIMEPSGGYTMQITCYHHSYTE